MSIDRRFVDTSGRIVAMIDTSAEHVDELHFDRLIVTICRFDRHANGERQNGCF